MKAGVFGKIVFNENVKDDILYSNVYRQCGSEIGADISSNNRVGVFVVKAKTKEALLQKTSQIINNMEVYDIKGNPVMRKDIYKNQ
jgi:hypothetical protein